MARPIRLQYPGAFYHVTDRGDRKEAVFTCNADRISFLQLLNTTSAAHEWHVLAYCLMDNHYHLMLETARPNLAAGMARLNGVYTQRFNRVYDSVGHVFQGRYKSQAIQSERHLLEACRYIVLNPLRAGLVNDPADWQWSSYRASAGLSPALSCLDAPWVREKVTVDGTTDRYIDWVREGVGRPCDFLRSQPSLEIQTGRPPAERPLIPDRIVPPLSEILAGCTWVHGGDDVLRSRIGDALNAGYSQRAIAKQLGISNASVSRFSTRRASCR
ncbi:MAG: transposase [Caldiserica bacterium]|nr:transposase [Caldisericota bacterium]